MKKLAHSRLREVISYDPGTGQFAWLIDRPKAPAGYPAGGVSKQSGYVRIRVDAEFFQAHRLAWFWMTGNWPPNQIDHIDLNRGNNAWANLRLATNAQNMANRRAPKNNRSGVKGVSFKKSHSRWSAELTKDGRKKHLGLFKGVADAAAAYARAAQAEFGRFARAA